MAEKKERTILRPGGYQVPLDRGAPSARAKHLRAVEIERAVAGCYLCDWGKAAETLDEAGIPISPYWFSDKVSREVMREVLDAHAKGVVWEQVKVLEGVYRRLKVSAEDESDREMVDLVCSLEGAGCATANLALYVGRVRALYQMRAMYDFYGDALHAVSQHGQKVDMDSLDPVGFLGKWAGRMTRLEDSLAKGVSEFIPVGDCASTLFDSIQRAVNSKDYSEFEGMKTGFPPLDEATNGLQPGTLNIVGARTSIGKSAFALHAAAMAVARDWVPDEPDNPENTKGEWQGRDCCLFFSLEMTALALARRMVARAAMVDANLLKKVEKLTSDELIRLAEAEERMKGCPIHIQDTAGLTVSDIRSMALRFHRKMMREGGGVRLVVVDYLQLVETGAPAGSLQRVAEVGKISRGLKAMAKDLGCPVLALAQLNRQKEGRANQDPILSDLRESGDIEQDADVVIFLDTAQEQGQDIVRSVNVKGRHYNCRVLNMIVAKNRDGRQVPKTRLEYNPGLSSFRYQKEKSDGE